MAEIKDWDIAAAGNGFAAPDGFPEGMQYSDVNNSAREIMAVIARWQKDTNGSLVTAGSSNAYTLTPNRTISAYTAGLKFAFRADRDNTGSATLNVSAVGAGTIKHPDGRNLDAGEIKTDGIYEVTYSVAYSGWIIANTGSKASTTRKGDVELATDAEAIAGTDNERAVTPSNLTAMGVTGNAGRFTSSEQSLSTGTSTTIAHGLSAKPFNVRASIICKAAEYGYAVGDEVNIDHGFYFDGGSGEERGIAIAYNSTNLYVVQGASGITIYRRDGGSVGQGVSVTPANWKIIVRAQK